MTLQIKDRIRETSATTGTGTYTLAGAVAGFNPFSDISDADTTYYLAERGSQWEIGLGTVGGTGTTLARTTVLRSSNADAAVNWGTGTKHIASIVPAQLLEKLAEVGSDTFAEFVRDTVGTALTAGANITVTPDDGADTITVDVTAMTASRAVETDGSGNLTVSAVTATELGYVSGATSNLQAQIAALQALTIRQPAVIDRVDNTAAPPTEVSGDRYLLQNVGASHANWDGAAGNSIVEYDGASWVETVPAEGWVVYVDSSDTDWLAVDDGTLSWEERTAAAISLNGLLDVVITGPSAGHVLKYNGSTWVNAALTASNISDPENFTFTASQISDFSEAVDDRVSTLLVAGSGVSLTYDDGANTLTIDAGASVGQLADLTDVDDSLSGNAGDLLYHNGTHWTDLDIGTAGQVLRVNTGATAPEWADVTGPTNTYAQISNVPGTQNPGSYTDFDTSDFAVGITTTVTTNDGKFTIPTGGAGKYFVTGRVEIHTTGAAASRDLFFLRIQDASGVLLETEATLPATQYEKRTVQISGILDLAAADWLRLYTFVTGTASDFTITDGLFSIYKLA